MRRRPYPQPALCRSQYVVDTVSRDGVHKCVAIWKYIKFPLNGAENVFYGQRLLCVDSEPHLRQMVEVCHKPNATCEPRSPGECWFSGGEQMWRRDSGVKVDCTVLPAT